VGAPQVRRAGVPIAIVHIADLDDPRIAAYRHVTDRALLEQRGAFVAEGRSVVERLLASGWGTESLLVTRTALDALGASTAIRDVPIYVVEQGLMDTTVGFNIHRGCLALGRRPPVRAWASFDGARRLVALEAISDADNVGSTFRNAAAFGADGVLLDPRTTDPLYRKAVRTSMGSIFTVPFARATTSDAFVEGLRHLGRRSAVVALTPAPDAPPLDAVAASVAGHPSVVVVLGQEAAGLSATAMHACTHRARIPMAAGVDSLNVATAGAIALYALSHR
jgi:tRNA G18 (ribose-2'-O)-methylase SpoU